MKLRRRGFLASAAAAGMLAGCLGRGGSGSSDGGDSSDTSSVTGGETVSESTTADPNPATDSNRSASAGTPPAASLDHPATTDLAGQPSLGPTPGTAPGLIIAFEDPSCHNCERFNTGTLPELESKLINPGNATYVYRNYPHAFKWGKPAMQALEATDARNESAFWKLKTHYFATQDQFSESNVLDRTQAFLADETSLDAAAVVEDARAKKYDKAVQRDTDAGNAAGVVSTPTFYLFRDGEFLTEIRGAQSYQVFEQSLSV